MHVNPNTFIRRSERTAPYPTSNNSVSHHEDVFGKKKNKTKATPTRAARQEQPQQQLKSTAQTTVVKYVGASKHVTTNSVDSMGRQVSRTEIIKLTPDEMEELGIVPKVTTTTAATALTDSKSDTDSNYPYIRDNQDDQSMAGYSMAGYSLGGFSDILPPPSFQNQEKNHQNLKESYQPPPSTANMMVTPVDDEDNSSKSSQEQESVSLREEDSLDEKHHKQKQQQQQERQQPAQPEPHDKEAHSLQDRQKELDALAVASANASIDNSVGASAAEEYMAAIDVTRELVKKFITDIWNRGEIDLIPIICHPSLRFNGHVGMDRVGHEGFARMVTTVREALTDYHCEIHSMVVESTKAFCRLRFTGKHTGNLLGYPPTGKTVAWMGASEFTCKNGKILKVWELGDLKSLEEQLRSVI
ncbi:SnoaL-like polyketide cyclase [Nitzschia inconspicua]|uniref:SnoaL-like polyketide cyclase n=1 Tax=Nitzschia inconspicua TaxID=303405 RepID=A0A9K3LW97_9STRA|nr:SnoaL-like polyketide cyclase [Nitzschia inconspicua]